MYRIELEDLVETLGNNKADVARRFGMKRRQLLHNNIDRECCEVLIDDDKAIIIRTYQTLELTPAEQKRVRKNSKAAK